MTVARGVSFAHLLPHRGRGVRRGAFSDTVPEGKQMPLGERVCAAPYRCPFSVRATPVIAGVGWPLAPVGAQLSYLAVHPEVLDLLNPDYSRSRVSLMNKGNSILGV